MTPSKKFDPWSAAYKYRFVAAGLTLFSVITALVLGVGQIRSFSSKVDALKEVPAADSPPRLFDQRTDIWFDPQGDALAAYRDIEDQFIAEDIVLLAFEDTEDPWGVFGEKGLSTIQRLTAEIERIPYVRSVRSLTDSPWIRWGQAANDEEGLMVGDFYERPVSEYTKEERLQRMIAVLGAERASKLAGEEAVQRVLGEGESFSEHMSQYIGEPRFLNSIVSADGRTAAIQIHVLRQKVDSETLDGIFGSEQSTDRDVGPVLHTIESQGSAVTKIKQLIANEKGYSMHLAGIPVLEQHFPEVGMADMAYLGLMFGLIALVLYLIFRRTGGVAMPLLIVTATILGMNGAVWYFGDLINNLTAAAPIVMTAVGIADAVHLVTSYYLLRPNYTDRQELVTAVMRKNALPVLLTSVTTAAAFFSLMTSHILPVKMLGYTTGLGTLIAWALSMTVVPALLSLIPLPSRENQEEGTAAEDRAEDKAQNDAKTRQTAQAASSLSETKPHWTAPLLAFVMRFRGRILLTAAATAALAAVGMSQVQVESDMRLMFPSDDPVASDIRWIEQRLGGAGDLDLVFYGPERHDQAAHQKQQKRLEALELRELRKESLTAAERAELAQLRKTTAEYERARIASNGKFLAELDRFEKRLSAEAKDPNSPLSALTSFDSGLSVLRKIHQVQNENQAAFYRVPTAEDLPPEARRASVLYDDITDESLYVPPQSASSMASQYYLQYENGAKPAQNLSALVTQDRHGVRIAARVANRPSAELLETYDRIYQIAQKDFPTLVGSPEQVKEGSAMSTLRLSGKHFLFVNMLERFTDTLILSMLLAMAVITLIIAFVFRSLWLGLISMVPNVLPLIVPLGMLGILGIPLDGPAVIVATVALGVCVDDTIHLLSHFKKAKAQGLSTTQALAEALKSVGSALTWTSVVLVVGFGAMALSQFRPNMMIGALGTAMVALAWFADLILTPALLSYLSPKEQRQSTSDAEPIPVPAE